jgi:hypothetical protein
LAISLLSSILSSITDGENESAEILFTRQGKDYKATKAHLARQFSSFLTCESSMQYIDDAPEYTSERDAPTLRMFLTGAAGCGKTETIQFFRDFARRWNALDKLCFTATSGIAAMNPPRRSDRPLRGEY